MFTVGSIWKETVLKEIQKDSLNFTICLYNWHNKYFPILNIYEGSKEVGFLISAITVGRSENEVYFAPTSKDNLGSFSYAISQIEQQLEIKISEDIISEYNSAYILYKLNNFAVSK